MSVFSDWVRRNVADPKEVLLRRRITTFLLVDMALGLVLVWLSLMVQDLGYRIENTGKLIEKLDLEYHSGLTAEQAAALAAVDLTIADLDGGTLGLSEGTTIWLDQTAAGYGWFIDPTPQERGRVPLRARAGRVDRGWPEPGVRAYGPPDDRDARTRACAGL